MRWGRAGPTRACGSRSAPGSRGRGGRGLAEIPVGDRCEDVDDELLEAIEEGLTVDAELEDAKAVASEEEDVTFVAAEVVGEGFHDESRRSASGRFAGSPGP